MVVRPRSSVMVSTESSRTVTTARPPINTLTMEFSAVLMRSRSKMLSLNFSGSVEELATCATVACPSSVVTLPTGVPLSPPAGIDASEGARAIAREIQRNMTVDHRRRMFDLQERTRSHERTSVSEWTARSFGARRILSLALTVSVECADAGRDETAKACSVIRVTSLEQRRGDHLRSGGVVQG